MGAVDITPTTIDDATDGDYPCRIHDVTTFEPACALEGIGDSIGRPHTHLQEAGSRLKESRELRNSVDASVNGKTMIDETACTTTDRDTFQLSSSLTGNYNEELGNPGTNEGTEAALEKEESTTAKVTTDVQQGGSCTSSETTGQAQDSVIRMASGVGGTDGDDRESTLCLTPSEAAVLTVPFNSYVDAVVSQADEPHDEASLESGALPLLCFSSTEIELHNKDKEMMRCELEERRNSIRRDDEERQDLKKSPAEQDPIAAPTKRPIVAEGASDGEEGEISEPEANSPRSESASVFLTRNDQQVGLQRSVYSLEDYQAMKSRQYRQALAVENSMRSNYGVLSTLPPHSSSPHSPPSSSPLEHNDWAVQSMQPPHHGFLAQGSQPPSDSGPPRGNRMDLSPSPPPLPSPTLKANAIRQQQQQFLKTEDSGLSHFAATLQPNFRLCYYDVDDGHRRYEPQLETQTQTLSTTGGSLPPNGHLPLHAAFRSNTMHHPPLPRNYLDCRTNANDTRFPVTLTPSPPTPSSSLESPPHGGCLYRLVLSILGPAVDVHGLVKRIESECHSSVGIRYFRGTSEQSTLRLDFHSSHDLATGLRCSEGYAAMTDLHDPPPWTVLSVTRVPLPTPSSPVSMRPHAIQPYALPNPAMLDTNNDPSGCSGPILENDYGTRHGCGSETGQHDLQAPGTVPPLQFSPVPTDAPESSDAVAHDNPSGPTAAAEAAAAKSSPLSLCPKQHPSPHPPHHQGVLQHGQSVGVSSTVLHATTRQVGPDRQPSPPPFSSRPVHSERHSADSIASGRAFDPSSVHPTAHDYFDAFCNPVIPPYGAPPIPSGPFPTPHGILCQTSIPYHDYATHGEGNYMGCVGLFPQKDYYQKQPHHHNRQPSSSAFMPYPPAASTSHYPGDYHGSREQRSLFNHSQGHPSALLSSSSPFAASYNPSPSFHPPWPPSSIPSCTAPPYGSMHHGASMGPFPRQPQHPQHPQHPLSRSALRFDNPLEARKLSPVSFWCEHLTLEQQAEDYRKLVSRFGFTNRYTLVRNLPQPLRTAPALKKFVQESSETSEEFEIEISEYATTTTTDAAEPNDPANNPEGQIVVAHISFKTKKGAQHAARKMQEKLSTIPEYSGVTLEQTGPRRSNDTLWIGNIKDFMISEPYGTEFFELFSYFGKVLRLKMMPERNCAFVEYENTEYAKCARNHLHGAMFGLPGREVHLNVDFSAGEAVPNCHQRQTVKTTECRFCNSSLMANYQESVITSHAMSQPHAPDLGQMMHPSTGYHADDGGDSSTQPSDCNGTPIQMSRQRRMSGGSGGGLEGRCSFYHAHSDVNSVKKRSNESCGMMELSFQSDQDEHRYRETQHESIHRRNSLSRLTEVEGDINNHTSCNNNNNSYDDDASTSSASLSNCARDASSFNHRESRSPPPSSSHSTTRLSPSSRSVRKKGRSPTHRVPHHPSWRSERSGSHSEVPTSYEDHRPYSSSHPYHSHANTGSRSKLPRNSQTVSSERNRRHHLYPPPREPHLEYHPHPYHHQERSSHDEHDGCSERRAPRLPGNRSPQNVPVNHSRRRHRRTSSQSSSWSLSSSKSSTRCQERRRGSSHSRPPLHQISENHGTRHLNEGQESHCPFHLKNQRHRSFSGGGHKSKNVHPQGDDVLAGQMRMMRDEAVDDENGHDKEASNEDGTIRKGAPSTEDGGCVRGCTSRPMDDALTPSEQTDQSMSQSIQPARRADAEMRATNHDSDAMGDMEHQEQFEIQESVAASEQDSAVREFVDEAVRSPPRLMQRQKLNRSCSIPSTMVVSSSHHSLEEKSNRSQNDVPSCPKQKGMERNAWSMNEEEKYATRTLYGSSCCDTTEQIGHTPNQTTSAAAALDATGQRDIEPSRNELPENLRLKSVRQSSDFSLDVAAPIRDANSNRATTELRLKVRDASRRDATKTDGKDSIPATRVQSMMIMDTTSDRQPLPRGNPPPSCDADDADESFSKPSNSNRQLVTSSTSHQVVTRKRKHQETQAAQRVPQPSSKKAKTSPKASSSVHRRVDLQQHSDNNNDTSMKRETKKQQQDSARRTAGKWNHTRTSASVLSTVSSGSSDYPERRSRDRVNRTRVREAKSLSPLETGNLHPEFSGKGVKTKATIPSKAIAKARTSMDIKEKRLSSGAQCQRSVQVRQESQQLTTGSDLHVSHLIDHTADGHRQHPVPLQVPDDERTNATIPSTPKPPRPSASSSASLSKPSSPPVDPSANPHAHPPDSSVPASLPSISGLWLRRCQLYKQGQKLCVLRVALEKGDATAEIPDVMDVNTRTTAAKLQLRLSKKLNAFTLWRLLPESDLDRPAYLSFCEYFKSRDRIGLLETPTSTVFIVPLEAASHDDLLSLCQLSVNELTILAFVSPKTQNRALKPLPSPSETECV